jgi:acetate kinase
MNILVINCGSSSLKFQIIETDIDLIQQHQDKVKLKGHIERIGSQALIKIKVTNKPEIVETTVLKNHAVAIEYILKKIVAQDLEVEGIRSFSDIHAIGHRVVHGGEQFNQSVLINEKVLKGIEECIDLAPLHNPHNLKGIQSCLSLLGHQVPQVAVFDTAFHATIPEVNYLYAIPYQYYRRYHIRKYGFHGTSHRYIAYRYRILCGLEKTQVNAITIHLGNGASACAIKEGNSFDTSMGFTPLSGLIMGTRSGDIDPSIIDYISHKEGIPLDNIDSILNKSSGLLGISGLTNDMRDLLAEVEEHQDRRARLAIDMFCTRVKHYIGAYLAQMNGTDVIIFTGGIGENSAEIREKICANLSFFGVELEDSFNKEAILGKEMQVSSSKSKVKVWVIPTNEELLIARDTFRCVTL